MSDYRDDNSIQTEEELGRLEDSREREDERPRGRAADPRDLPRPLFRIKALHSNETFYAYFPQSPKGQVPSTPQGSVEASAAGELPEPEGAPAAETATRPRFPKLIPTPRRTTLPPSRPRWALSRGARWSSSPRATAGTSARCKAS